MSLSRTPSTFVSRDILNEPSDVSVLEQGLLYHASDALISVAFVLILITAILQTVCTWRWGAKWMLAMVIGGYTYALGIALRYGLHGDSRETIFETRRTILFILESILVYLSPCAFVATNHILLVWLVRRLGCEQHLLISPNKIIYVLVAADLTTFVAQLMGVSILVSSKDYVVWVASVWIPFGGLVGQLFLFTVFTGIYLHFLHRVYTLEPEVWKRGRLQDASAPEDSAPPTKMKWYNHWHALAASLGISCVGILIRLAFRVAELGQGYKGALTTSEAAFYGLDMLPLLVATAVFVPFWPGRFIVGDKTTASWRRWKEEEGVEMGGRKKKSEERNN